MRISCCYWAAHTHSGKIVLLKDAYTIIIERSTRTLEQYSDISCISKKEKNNIKLH